MAFDTPILFIVFNRPNHTRKVFERIREIKPKYLFVAADGPRNSNAEDIGKCAKVREIIIKGIDWPCETKTLFREENFGCGRGPAHAITWFFDEVDEGIILEDDCLPDVFFFNFCSVLLKRYRNDEQIMHIGGSNFQNGKKAGDYSYYFSGYSHNWGWATWKKSWFKFNHSITNLDRMKLSRNLTQYGFSRKEIEFWTKVFEQISVSKPSDVWDYQWIFAIWMNRGLSIVPGVNLVTNIGFDADGTHTGEAHKFLSVISGSLSSIQHRPVKEINFKADRYTFNNYYSIRPSFLKRMLLAFKSIIRRKIARNNFFSR